MRVHINKINGGVQQFADEINNHQPLVVEVQRLRAVFDRHVEHGDVPADVTDAVEAEFAKAEAEASSTKPRRSRFKEIFANVALMTSGVTAATDLTKSIEAALQTIASLE